MRPAPAEVRAADLAQLCHRIRAAGAPGSKARPKLVSEFRRLAGLLGVAETPDITTGRDLERAASLLLRRVSERERSAPAARRPRRER